MLDLSHVRPEVAERILRLKSRFDQAKEEVIIDPDKRESLFEEYSGIRRVNAMVRSDVGLRKTECLEAQYQSERIKAQTRLVLALDLMHKSDAELGAFVERLIQLGLLAQAEDYHKAKLRTVRKERGFTTRKRRPRRRYPRGQYSLFP